MQLFVSYARVDKPIVKQLVEIFEEAGHEAWLDHKLLPGQDWKATLLEKISQCEIFVYALTPESATSDWCQWELKHAVNFRKPVLPVLMQAKTVLPTAIEHLQYADFTEGANYRAAASLLGGLHHLAVTIPPEKVILAPPIPSGLPAYADKGDSTFELPLLEWCDIPEGEAIIETRVHNHPTFQVAKYPVTNAQYEVFATSYDGYNDFSWWNYAPEAIIWRKNNPSPKSSEFTGDKRPREMVTWYEAMAFCRWLSHKLSLPVTLPTEVYRKATYGPGNNLYPWGDVFDSTKCNCRESLIRKTTSVDKYSGSVSSYGVMDLSGNVWEWSITGIATAEGLERLMYGGGWRGRHRHSVAIYPRTQNPKYCAPDVGFRVYITD